MENEKVGLGGTDPIRASRSVHLWPEVDGIKFMYSRKTGGIRYFENRDLLHL